MSRINGRRCIAANCGNTNRDGVNLHHFPLDRPSVLKKWVSFVQLKRKWEPSQVTKYSVLCSEHFSKDCYPQKYSIMESMGIVVKKRDLQPDAVPSIHTIEPAVQTPDQPNGVKRPTPQPQDTPISSPPSTKKPRGAFIKRENMRIIKEYSSSESTPPKPAETSSMTEHCYTMTTDELDVSPDMQPAVTSPTRDFECQFRYKPSKRSIKLQTKIPTRERACQTKPPKTQECGIQCSIIPSPSQEPLLIDEDSHMDSFCEDEPEPSNHDAMDTSYQASTIGESSDEYDSDEEIERLENGQELFLVSLKKLRELFVVCPNCCAPTYGHVKCIVGTLIKVRQECVQCKFARCWDSQEYVGSIPHGNLVMSCGILFSGSLPSRVLRMCKFMNLSTISTSTFMQHQRHYLQPAITELWEDRKKLYVTEVIEAGNSVCLGGDGRADTPGHSAKFGSYSVMDLDKGMVVDLQLIQSNEVKGSCNMEKEGLIRSMKYFDEHGVTVNTIVTDRHVQIVKWVRENLPETKHCVDVWHVAKGLKKKLTALSKEKECEILQPWIKSIVNHVYWVASSTQTNDSELMLEKWLSVGNHIQNKHEGHGEKFSTCQHGDLGERKKKWLLPCTKVTEKLLAMFKTPQMKKDVKMLSTGHQTSEVEAYHSVINHFAPKMTGFSYNGMMSRLTLAALHFNENRRREQMITRDGTPRYKITFPKQKKGEYTLRAVKQEATFGYVHRLMKSVVELASGSTMKKSFQCPVTPPPLCKDFIHPEKESAIASFKSRYFSNGH